MLMSSSRQEFLPGEPNGGGSISYNRKGGVFVSKCALLWIVLGAILLAIAVGLLVYLYAPFRDEEKAVVEDDLSWDIGELHKRNAGDTVRLINSVTPSYYRLTIKPNLTSLTFDGRVAITLSTQKSNVKHISLHVKDLQILNGTTLTEQNIYTSQLNKQQQKQPSPTRTRRQTENNTVTATPSNVTSTPSVGNTTSTNPTSTTPTPSTTVGNMANATTITSTTTASTNATKPTTILSQSKTKKMKIISKELNPAIDRLIFALDSHLKQNVNYTLEIKFKGNIGGSLNGFYKSTYKDVSDNMTKTLVVTQFEPISARKAFPCFDEPEFKAMFEISIARPRNMTVISNMPLSSEEDVEGEKDMVWSHFDRSLPMSPYLVAYMISELSARETTVPRSANDNTTIIPLKIWARKELYPQTAFAAEIAPKLMNFYESYFKIPYVLPKIDMVAIPDTAVGGMENWGLITFRETSLVVDVDNGSLLSKKEVAAVIAHELAHQWFGNLVTMRWWNDLWLNEGFATYMEYIGINEIKPEWKLLDQFHLDKMAVMAVDSIQSTRPVSAIVNDETQINQIFDDISYMKAASLLRMLNHMLTRDVFRDGLYHYMKKWQFKNADQSELWESFTMSAQNRSRLPANISVAAFMNSWTLEPGYPVLNVQRNYDNETVTISQKRFYFHTPTGLKTKQLWYVPITYAYGNTSSSNWTTTPLAWLEKTEKTTIFIPNGANETWAYFNVLGIGFYRVNYDIKNWKLLEYGLFDHPQEFPAVTRGQLIDDAFNLARAGQLNYTMALDLTKYMIDVEKHYMPWYCVLDNLRFLHTALQRSIHFELFQEYVSRLISPILEDVGYVPKANETVQDTLLRDKLISWACLIEDPHCLAWVQEKFSDWMNKTNPDLDNPIPLDSRVVIYSTALRMGGKKEYNFLFQRFKNSNDPEIKAEILIALPDTRNTWLLNNLLEYSITDMDLQMTPLLWRGFNSDLATRVAFNFVLDNWARIYKKHSQVDEHILQGVIEGAFGNIATEQDLRQYKRFVRANKEQLSIVSTIIYKNVERAVQRIQWAKTKVADIERWLIKFEESKQTAVNVYSTLYDDSFKRRNMKNNIPI